MTRVDVIANERLLDDRHHWHEIQEFWTDGPVALVLLRQFGSAFALKQARVLTARHDDIVGAGANVVFIGLGTPIQAYTFKQRARTRFTVLATADQTLYRTMGLSRDPWAIARPANLPGFLTAVREGAYPFSRTGDTAQRGGAFVVGAGGGEVLWDHRSKRAADIAPVDEMIQALQTHAGAPTRSASVRTGTTPRRPPAGAPAARAAGTGRRGR